MIAPSIAIEHKYGSEYGDFIIYILTGAAPIHLGLVPRIYAP